MMKSILLAISFTLFAACSNSSSDSGTNSAPVSGALSNSIDGTWVYVNPSSTQSVSKGFGAVISGNKVSLISMYIYQQPSGYQVYFRKNEGTFTKEGDKLTLNYSYQTCPSIQSEVVYAKINGNTATISADNGSLVYTMTKYASNDPNSPLNMTMIEDKGCTILSKLQKDKKSRSIASDGVGSIFDLKKLEK